jgi:hypothetical protein
METVLKKGVSMSDRSRFLDDPTARKILDDCMELFGQSIGMRFRVKGTPVIDEIEGIDWEIMMVKGKMYGNFSIELCELTNTDDTSITN